MQVTHDKKLLIAIGRSRKAAQWQNREMLWSEFLDKLANTTRTRETVNDYAAMTKAERDNVKDVGGFVGGYLKNGRRSSASVVNRCLVCLDADNADTGLLDDLDMTFINAYALYSTHSHTPEKMRRAMDFWRTSWEQGWFVRWAIALRSEVIGTVELCRREESPDDPYSGMGILRVDVGSAWEKSDVLAAVMDALLPDAYALLNCRTLMTKAAPYAVARVATLTECGFVLSDKPVMGHHGERFGDYWVREK